jgi:hypothetical protein
MENDRVYYSRRATEEREAALKAVHPKVRQAHLELAKSYDERLAKMASSASSANVDLIGVA